MFISRRNHETIVSLLKDQLAEMRADRDRFRDIVLGRPSEGTEITARPPYASRSEVTPERIDANWTADDRDVFFGWAKENVGPGLDPYQVWRERYQGASPLVALTA